MKSILPIFVCILFLSACDTGALLTNQPPETRMFLDEINLTGEQRLNSVVKLHWSGEDIDGYVAGYEISTNGGQTWGFTPSSDSTFRFDILPGSDTTDIDFRVRAIDNEALADPDPARLIVPIKNTPPIARLDTINLIPDTVYTAWSILWSVDDLDGVETLDSIFIRLNDGPWYGIERVTNFMTFLPENPSIAGEQTAQLFSGPDAIPLPNNLAGLEVGADNRLYMRARDISGTFSQVDSSKSFFVRQQQSDLLVIDAHGTSSADNVYFPILQKVYPGYDYLNLRAELPPYWSPTFGFLLNQYDKVFWYSDGAEIASLGQRLLMEVAAVQLQDYLNQGGKLFMTARFPNSFNRPDAVGESLVFGFSPMDSLSSAPGQARIPVDSLIFPVGNFANTLDPLVCASFISGADPFYPKDAVNNILNTQLVSSGGWTGPRTVCARTLFSNGRTNQVFISIELHKLNKDPQALEKFMSHVFSVEFDW